MIKVPFNLITTLCVTLLVVYTVSLSAEQVSNTCHCDLTQSFCDFDCCCDLDCSSQISNACFNSKSSQFCIDPQFYFRINPLTSLTSSASQNCYYFNTTLELQEEVTLPTWQAKSFASRISRTEALPNTTSSMYNGYSINSLFQIGSASTFTFLKANGDCVQSSETGTLITKIRFGSDIDITCKATSNSIKLFQLLGKTVKQYYLMDNSQTIEIPSPSEDYTKVVIYFFISYYGSQKAIYIESVSISSQNVSGSSTRTLSIRFIDEVIDFENEEGSPSFFPQIPFDIFYPIYEAVYTF